MGTKEIKRITEKLDNVEANIGDLRLWFFEQMDLLGPNQMAKIIGIRSNRFAYALQKGERQVRAETLVAYCRELVKYYEG